MSDTPSKSAPTTEEEFEAALGKLIAAAETNDIDTAGSWPYNGDVTPTNWEVLVSELA